MNPQMTVCHKIMQILDDNAQQVPEGFYLEVCGQLKNLHVASERHEPDERELILDEAERMLDRREARLDECVLKYNKQVEDLNRRKTHLNECVLNYNKKAASYSENVKKYNRVAANVKRVQTAQLAREARLDDREDNITLAQLQRQLLE